MKKPLVFWFRMIWWIMRQGNGASALGLRQSPGLGCTLRHVMARHDLLPETIQVDEIYVGDEKAGGSGTAGKV